MKKALIVIIICFSTFGCLDSVSPEQDETVYTNNFEKESDFEGWKGITMKNLKNDILAEGDKYSVFISGGCVHPHAFYVFKNKLTQGCYTIECRGKAFPKTFGGAVSLKYQGSEDHIFSSVDIVFSDSVWTHKISDTLFYDETSDLEIEMNAGGFVASAMLIDNLIVKKIK